ncbi:ImmA/IrrE family metallo-endopeptidase [Pseudoalteromonas sp. B62]|uniref:ImmA/IrrE family metallo-endopeptidase n=1 Tax=Pseudoalteromonas sp. B62 TaxID=630483 RepID=UPI00301C894F
MNYREATLRGTRGASEALSRLGLKTKIKEGLHQIDVFDSLKQLDVVTVCRPLEGLLGAYTMHGKTHGVMVSTNRRLPIQRFTAAHELGHFWLQHGTSLDSEESIGDARNVKGNAPFKEVEAEAFASEFILPKSLVGYTIRRQNYAKPDLKNPETIYQLSLRLGASYSATRVAMQNHKFISLQESTIAASVSPKSIKQCLLKGLGINASHPDVFILTEKDNGSYILSGPEDTVIIELQEHSTSGYSWTEIPSSTIVNTLLDLT